jgi:prepilin-type N-terminal cleavage/methylation domain-containing protein
MQKHKNAFSLIELSVVLVVIGVMVTGIMQGVSLIYTSRITNARSITTKSIVPEIKGLFAWYETSMIDSFSKSEVADGSQITEWRDISPSSISAQRNKLTEASSSDISYKRDGINLVPSAQINVAGGKFQLSNFYQGKSAQYTIFLVFRPGYTTSSSKKILLDAYNGNDRASIGVKNNAVNLRADTSVDTGTSSNPASFSSGGNYIIAAYFDSTNSKVYVNDAITAAGAGTIDPGSKQLQGLSIGADKNGGDGFVGLISEVVIYNRVLQISERKDVMSYLSKKYKIFVTGI